MTAWMLLDQSSNGEFKSLSIFMLLFAVVVVGMVVREREEKGEKIEGVGLSCGCRRGL